MFLFNFSQSKTKRFLSVLAVLFVAASVLCVSGCSDSVPSNGSVYGKWIDSWESVYEISETDFKNYGPGYSSYEGTNVKVVPEDETSGTIFFVYTVAAMPDWSYSENAPDVGKWYAVHYKDLTENSVSLSGAAGAKTSAETFEEAADEFTVANGYFVYYSDCIRVSD